MKISKEKLVKIIKEEMSKQEYDALTTMITRLDGMAGFLMTPTRKKSNEALTLEAARLIEELREVLSQMIRG